MLHMVSFHRFDALVQNDFWTEPIDAINRGLEKNVKKDAKERRKFLRTCRDISMLRDVALFETDKKLKEFARKQARRAESSAQSASAAAVGSAAPASAK